MLSFSVSVGSVENRWYLFVYVLGCLRIDVSEGAIFFLAVWHWLFFSVSVEVLGRLRTDYIFWCKCWVVLRIDVSEEVSSFFSCKCWVDWESISFSVSVGSFLESMFLREKCSFLRCGKFFSVNEVEYHSSVCAWENHCARVFRRGKIFLKYYFSGSSLSVNFG